MNWKEKTECLGFSYTEPQSGSRLTMRDKCNADRAEMIAEGERLEADEAKWKHAAETSLVLAETVQKTCDMLEDEVKELEAENARLTGEVNAFRIDGFMAKALMDDLKQCEMSRDNYREEREAARDHAEALHKKLNEAGEREKRLREALKWVRCSLLEEPLPDVPWIAKLAFNPMAIEVIDAALSGETIQPLEKQSGSLSEPSTVESNHKLDTNSEGA